MNEHLTKWLEALRSGEYGQAKRALRYGANSFCCLGVACELHDPSEWQLEPDTDSIKEAKIFYGRDIELPPSHVLDKMDLPLEMRTYIHPAEDMFFDRQNVYVIENDNPKPSKVSDLNDSGYSFSEIADMIEATYNRFSVYKGNTLDVESAPSE